MANVLITGGTGLIGWCAARELIEQGHRPVLYDLRPNDENLRRIGADCVSIEGDVTDAPSLRRVIEQQGISHILHLAAFIAHEGKADPAGTFRVNVMGTANIFEAALALDVKRVVWTSSAVALTTGAGYDGVPVDDRYDIVSRSPYGASKWACEVLGETFHDQMALDNVAFRPALVYGIGRLFGGTGLFNAAIRDIAQGRPAGIMASPGGVHQPIYNKDMAALLVAVLFGPKPSRQVYNVPAPRSYSSDDLLAVIRAIVPDTKIHTDRVPDFVSPIPVMDGSRALKEFAFSPRYDLERGLREMIAYYRES